MFSLLPQCAGIYLLNAEGNHTTSLPAAKAGTAQCLSLAGWNRDVAVMLLRPFPPEALGFPCAVCPSKGGRGTKEAQTAFVGHARSSGRVPMLILNTCSL